uniref:Zona pellucida glycoprotein beta chain (Fragments) n=1 Tax=Sus scrofa domesticus TaxID=9825 RepID=Q7M399_PIG
DLSLGPAKCEPLVSQDPRPAGNLSILRTNRDQLNKACSFSKSSNRWSPVEGPAVICRC